MYTVQNSTTHFRMNYSLFVDSCFTRLNFEAIVRAVEADREREKEKQKKQKEKDRVKQLRHRGESSYSSTMTPSDRVLLSQLALKEGANKSNAALTNSNSKLDADADADADASAAGGAESCEKSENTRSNLRQQQTREKVEKVERVEKVSGGAVGAHSANLQLGRRAENVFTLDFAYPFSPLQAFGVALSALHWKFGVD